jgi:hypothetical protein
MFEHGGYGAHFAKRLEGEKPARDKVAAIRRGMKSCGYRSC